MHGFIVSGSQDLRMVISVVFISSRRVEGILLFCPFSLISFQFAIVFSVRFPLLFWNRDEKVYFRVLDEMIRQEFALKAMIQDWELRVLYSRELLMKHWRKFRKPFYTFQA